MVSRRPGNPFKWTQAKARWVTGQGGGLINEMDTDDSPKKPEANIDTKTLRWPSQELNLGNKQVRPFKVRSLAFIHTVY